MKTIILFSSIFYLIGLAVGSTIEGVKNTLLPSKTIITSPLKKTEKTEKSFHFKADEGETKPKKVETETNKENGSASHTESNSTILQEQG